MPPHCGVLKPTDKSAARRRLASCVKQFVFDRIVFIEIERIDACHRIVMIGIDFVRAVQASGRSKSVGAGRLAAAVKRP